MRLVEPAKLTRAIMCLQREMGRRKSLYSRWVAEGRMREKDADVEISDLQDAIDILLALKVYGTVAVMREEQKPIEFGGEDNVAHQK